MTLTYVGGTSGSNNDGSNYAVSLTSLTGGAGSAPIAGDLVIVATGFAGTSDSNPGVTTSGYTELTDLYSDDSNDSNFSVNWKIMSVSPDTSVTAISGVSTHAGVTVIQVWRNADSVTPIDVTTTTATGTNGRDFDSPEITPVTSGAVVLSMGGAAHSASVTTTLTSEPTGYSNVVFLAKSGTNQSFTAGLASKAWTSGAEDPAAWDISGNSNSDAWCAATVVLRPLIVPSTSPSSSVSSSPSTSPSSSPSPSSSVSHSPSASVSSSPSTSPSSSPSPSSSVSTSPSSSPSPSASVSTSPSSSPSPSSSRSSSPSSSISSSVSTSPSASPSPANWDYEDKNTDTWVFTTRDSL